MTDPISTEANGVWFGNFGQISISTLDLSASVRFWEDTLGIGPWLIYRGLTLEAVHEGVPVKTPFDIALGWHDGRVVELFQATGDGPSIMHDALNRSMPGLNRLASVTRDFDQDSALAERRGMVKMTYGHSDGQRFAHYRSDRAPGIILELLELTPKFEKLVEDLKHRAMNFAASRGARVRAKESGASAATPATMKAALIGEYGAPDRFYLADLPVPQPGATGVRIRMVGAAVNPAEVKARLGRMRHWRELQFPAQLGGDIAGIVDAVGPDVTKLVVGDRVAGMINPFENGAYAEFVIADETQLAIVPPELDLLDAAALPTGALTGTQLVEIGIAPRVGQKVLVTGAGGSAGRAAVLALLDAGALPIAGVRASSRHLVDDLPVKVVDLGDETAIAAMGTIDAIADTVGGETLQRLFATVKPDGTVASIVMPPPIPPSSASQRMCSLVVRFDEERLRLFMHRLVETGRTMPVAKTFLLTEIAAAHALMEAGGLPGKVVITAEAPLA